MIIPTSSSCCLFLCDKVTEPTIGEYRLNSHCLGLTMQGLSCQTQGKDSRRFWIMVEICWDKASQNWSNMKYDQSSTIFDLVRSSGHSPQHSEVIEDKILCMHGGLSPELGAPGCGGPGKMLVVGTDAAELRVQVAPGCLFCFFFLQ